MRVFYYNDLDEEKLVRITEDKILESYWDYWCRSMKRINKEHLISKERCIEDFCVVYGAWEEYGQ